MKLQLRADCYVERALAMFQHLPHYVRMCIHIHIILYIYVHVYTYTHVYKHIYIYTYTHIYICTYIYIHIYTYSIYIHSIPSGTMYFRGALAME